MYVHVNICNYKCDYNAQLKKLGYENLDALDPSDEMLAVARSKNVYEKYFVEMINGDSTSIATGTTIYM